MGDDNLTLRKLLTQLTGREPPLDSDAPESAEKLLPDPGIGHSQLNEVLLLLGYDRVSASFFQYLIDGKSTYIPGTGFTGLGRINEGVDRFRKHAMWFYGNIRFAFQRMSNEAAGELEQVLINTASKKESEFEARHKPVQDIDKIPPEDTYYLGYIIADEMKERLKENPSDEKAKSELEKVNQVCEIGIKNHRAYLTWDHMDVYVATSMRQNHQYYAVNKITREIFGTDKLRSLKLRWFDPTQAYCVSRLDKGLAEALMLKRASCTLYLVQEADSFGKDSELATTLAQGKVVVAYVPKLISQGEFISELKTMHQMMFPEVDWLAVLRSQLQLYDPGLAWKDKVIREWIDGNNELNIQDIETKLFETARAVFDKRANLLLDQHPLGLQVDLETGVAHGVLVARTPEQCADLLHATITHQLEFEIKELKDKTLLLKEPITGSVARVVTGDDLLTNCFWNFYPS